MGESSEFNCDYLYLYDNYICRIMLVKHCCYGDCRSDSRKYGKECMKGVFWIPFPKRQTELFKCQTWVSACGRHDLTVENMSRWTYICSKHVVDGSGPTDEHPNPIPANFNK